MNKQKTQIVILTVVGFLALVGGILEDVVANQIPASLRPYMWLAWPLLIVIFLLTIFLSIYNYKMENDEVELHLTFKTLVYTKVRESRDYILRILSVIFGDKKNLLVIVLLICVIIMSILLLDEHNLFRSQLPAQVSTYFPFRLENGGYRIGLSYKLIGTYDDTGVVRGEESNFQIVDMVTTEDGKPLAIIQEVLTGSDFQESIDASQLWVYVDNNVIEFHQIHFSSANREQSIRFFGTEDVIFSPPLVMLATPIREGAEYINNSNANNIPVRSNCSVLDRRKITTEYGDVDSVRVYCIFESLEQSFRFRFVLNFRVAPEIGLVEAYGFDELANPFTLKIQNPNQ